MLKVKMVRTNVEDPSIGFWLKALIFTRENKMYRTVFEKPATRPEQITEIVVEEARLELQTHAPTENCHSLWGFTDSYVSGELDGDVGYLEKWNVCDVHFKPNQPDGGILLNGFRLCGTLFEKYPE